MANILITGAHGFIGKHLARYCYSQGHQVCGLGHGIWPEAEAFTWGLSHWINGDIQPGNLRLLQKSAGTPNIVYHLAGGSSVGSAVANPHEDFYRTVATTAELLEWLRLDAPNAKLVAVSSAAVYGSGHVGQIDEQAALSPYSPYGYHKRMMESLCASYADSYGIHFCLARLFSVYGEGLKKQLLWDICSKLAKGTDLLTLGGTGDELRDWTDVRDVVKALYIMGESIISPENLINVGTGIGMSVREIASQLLSFWNAGERYDLEIVFTNQSRVGDPFSLVANPSRLDGLGFKWAIPVSQGLCNYVDWFKTQQGVIN